ncbi:YfhE family protein [Lederbergia citrea]|uniref:YfhE family protein n=1 Tax=Lederbergia citrea TaxID=2833581 RepID=A0A942UU40_9BACI|nr:YfhE family protein [Lederbergia citrea]MBS4179123.1 YfhE family protein [Lederbergia citrea]MBS4205783.1 YfhE family protein [Lederbergia citrea]MBS4224768.1 YfhE family protein [Lederbergia citrea]
MRKRNEVDTRSTLSATQEVLYSNEFKKADKAGGFTDYQPRRRK